MNTFPVRRCSAALAYSVTQKGELRIVLVSNKSKDTFLFPKGGIEPGLSPEQNAQKECREEAGIDCADHGFSLGSYEFYKKGIVNQVEVFALFTDGRDAPKGFRTEGRNVLWIEPDRALECVDRHLAPFIIRLMGHIEGQTLHDSRKK